MRQRRPSRGALRSLIAVAAAAALVGTGAVAAQAAGGDVTGFVFRDFASDGTYDTGNAIGSGLPNDAPLGGVIVTAYDRTNTAVGTTTSLADGTYTLTVVGAATADLRVEFSFPAPLIAEGYESSYHGSQSGTSVQFVAIGDTDIDFAANVPEDFVGAAPRVGITAQRAGDPLQPTYPAVGAGWATDPDLYSSVVSVDYEADSDDASAPIAEATANGLAAHGIPTGALYGIAAPRGTNTFYASATLRRHTGLGAAGLGAIYSIDATTHVATLLIDLDNGAGGGIDVGEAQLSALLGSAGSATDNAARGLTADPAAPSYDEQVFPLIGTVGIGGMAISADDKTLFAINLYNRTLLAIDLATLAVTELPLDGLSADDRPFGVAVHHGQVYVGIVDSAASATGDAATRRTELAARVISAPLASIAAPSWTTALTIDDLSWPRGGASNGGFGTPDWTGDDVATHWNAWTDDWSAATQSMHGSGVIWSTNSQPLISSMAFDTNGTMAIGFLDRYTFQMGMNNYSLDTATPETQLYSGIASGGVLAASANGDGTFTLENNGSIAGATGVEVGTGRGPGGGQYYPSTFSAHNNAFTGAVASAPGFSTMLSTGYDITGEWTSDAAWLPTDGTATTLAQRVINNANGNNDPGTLVPGAGKAGGLGGVTLLAGAAPVEIGNRTWYDADFDGVQDADEPAVPGVTVTLTDAAGNPVVDADGVAIAPTTTDADGLYYFSNLVPETDYLVTFDGSTADVSGLTALFGITSPTQMTFTTQYSVSGGGTPVNDSNAATDTGIAPVSVGLAGQNDHTIDAGFVAWAAITVEKVVVGTAPAGLQFSITLECRDFRDEPLDPAIVTLTVAAGGFATAEFPAGTTCVVDEPDAGGALSTAYSLNGGDDEAEGPEVLIEGTVDDPTLVTVTNTFPTDTPPTPPKLTDTGSEIGPILPIGVLLLLLGAAAIGIAVVRKGKQRS